MISVSVGDYVQGWKRTSEPHSHQKHQLIQTHSALQGFDGELNRALFLPDNTLEQVPRQVLTISNLLAVGSIGLKMLSWSKRCVGLMQPLATQRL